MKTFIKAGAVAVAICGLSTTLSADPKPAGAKNAPPQLVANSVAGKTHIWKSCKGGIYYGGQWQAQAWCERKGPSIGIGTWSVNSKGRLCHELTWYWPKGDGYGSKKEPVTDRQCDDHVVAPDGVLWRSWGGEKDWWKFDTNPNLVKGFKMKRKVTRLRKKLGV